MNYLALILAIAPVGHTSTLYSEESHHGEDQDTFVVRIAPKMYAYTQRTGHEVCGALRFDGVYRIEIATSHRNGECALPGNTEIYVHTHPINQGFHFSKEDFVRPGYLIAEQIIKFQSGRVRTVAKKRNGVYK